MRVQFTFDILASYLRQYDEHDLVPRTWKLAKSQHDAITERAGDLMLAGMCTAESLVRATIEVLEGAPREPRRFPKQGRTRA